MKHVILRVHDVIYEVQLNLLHSIRLYEKVATFVSLHVLNLS